MIFSYDLSYFSFKIKSSVCWFQYVIIRLYIFQISSIKTRIDIESDKYNELITSKERQQQPSDGAEAAKIAFQIGKCEETLQALTNLLLHCCSGLQDSQQSLETAEDTEEQQLSSERHTIASSEDVEEDATTTTADRQPETEDLLSAVTLSNGISENADQLTADCCWLVNINPSLIFYLFISNNNFYMAQV